MPINAEAFVSELYASHPDWADRKPSKATRDLTFEAHRLHGAIAGLEAPFATLPDFDQRFREGLSALALHAANCQHEWLAVDDDPSFASVRGPAEKHRALVVSTLRYLCRADDAELALLDKVIEGEDLPDLVDDMHVLEKALVRNQARLAGQKRLPADAAQKCADFAKKLTSFSKTEAIVKAQAKRNVAFAALELAMREVRAAARFLFADQPRLLAEILGTTAPARRERKVEEPATVPEAPAKVPA